MISYITSSNILSLYNFSSCFIKFFCSPSFFSSKELFDIAGLEQQKVSMLIPGDSLMKWNNELFSYVNDILTASYINDLHTKEEKQNICEKLANEARRKVM